MNIKIICTKIEKSKSSQLIPIKSSTKLSFVLEMSETDFLACAEKLKSVGGNLANLHKLYFYARYKQATCGNCTSKQPGLLEFEGRKKWEAWKSAANLTTEEAQKDYVDKFNHLFGINYDFVDGKSKKEKENETKSEITTNNDDFGMTVNSKPAVIPDYTTKLSTSSDSVDLWCCLAQEDNNEGMAVLLESNSSLLNSVDDEGMTALHWAVDRNSMKALKFLFEHLDKLEIDLQNKCLETALHLSNDRATWDVLVNKFGIDTSIEDDLGEVASLIE